MAVLYTKVYTSNLLRMLRNLLLCSYWRDILQNRGYNIQNMHSKIHLRVEETLTDLTRHILMCKVTKCLYKSSFIETQTPLNLLFQRAVFKHTCGRRVTAAKVSTVWHQSTAGLWVARGA
jgi:hypothetical protein